MDNSLFWITISSIGTLLWSGYIYLYDTPQGKLKSQRSINCCVTVMLLYFLAATPYRQSALDTISIVVLLLVLASIFYHIMRLAWGPTQLFERCKNHEGPNTTNKDVQFGCFGRRIIDYIFVTGRLVAYQEDWEKKQLSFRLQIGLPLNQQIHHSPFNQKVEHTFYLGHLYALAELLGTPHIRFGLSTLATVRENPAEWFARPRVDMETALYLDVTATNVAFPTHV